LSLLNFDIKKGSNPLYIFYSLFHFNHYEKYYFFRYVLEFRFSFSGPQGPMGLKGDRGAQGEGYEGPMGAEGKPGK